MKSKPTLSGGVHSIVSESDRPPRRQPAGVAANLAPALLMAACLFMPPMMTLATAPPAVVRAVPEVVPAIPVHAFAGLSHESCTVDLPLHIGPSSHQGTLRNEATLRERMTNAVVRCEGDWYGYVVVGTRIDELGSIRDVRADTGGDGRMSTCVIRNIMRGGPVDAHGPGSLTVGYFMGIRTL